MFSPIHIGGQNLCDGTAARLTSEFNKAVSQQSLRARPQPAHAQDMRAAMASLSFSAMSAAGLQSFPGFSLTPTPGPMAGAISLPPSLIQYPTPSYPALTLGSPPSGDLRAVNPYQAVGQTLSGGDVSKLKSPVINRNYLELAMLVCNTFRGKLFPCPHCRYVTDRRNNLKRHISTMHQACDKQLECCGVSFSTKASLREHIMIFHHNGYSCPYCGRRFCRKALLKRHLSVHSGQKDYTCPNCDYATSHKSNLERHKRIHDRLKLVPEETGRYHCEDFRAGDQQIPDTTEDRCIVVEEEEEHHAGFGGRGKATYVNEDISDSDEDVEVDCDSSYHGHEQESMMPLNLQMHSLTRVAPVLDSHK